MTRHTVNTLCINALSADGKDNMTMQNLTTKDKLAALTAYVPEGEKSARAYIELVKSQALGLSKKGEERPFEDLLYFMKVAKNAGLDPTLKQIYAVYRWNSTAGRETMSIQAGIDGLRSIAERTGMYGGSDDVVYEEKDGKPVKATVTVYKVMNGQRMPVTASARFTEYNAGQGMWNKMPYLMLGKCAEALALRKAFPVISGIYTPEEMEQAEKLPEPVSDGKVELVDTKATAAKLKEEVNSESDN